MEDWVDEYQRKHGHPPNFLPDPIVTEQDLQTFLQELNRLQSQPKPQEQPRESHPPSEPPK